MLRITTFLVLCIAAALAKQAFSVGNTKVQFHDDTHYTYSLDEGNTWSYEYEATNEMKLSYGHFDPLFETLPQAPGFDFSRAQRVRSPVTTRLIQFHTIVLSDYKEELHARFGVEFHWVMPEQGYLVTMPTGTNVEAIRALPYVRWVGNFEPHYKFEHVILQQRRSNFTRYNIMAITKDSQFFVADQIKLMGGTVHYTNKLGWRIEASLTHDQLLTVATMDHVMFIDKWSEPETDMDIARMISGADYLAQVGPPNYNGEGVAAEVCDSGLRATHQDFRYLGSRLIIRQNGGSTSHGTSVFGIVFGNGMGNSKATGLLIDPARAIFQAYGSLGNRYTHTAALVDPQGPYRAVFQTNSWGGARTLQYTSVSAEMDDIINDLDFVILQSQSNAGNQQSRPQAWAKNIVSIGGVKHKDTLTRVDDDWTRGASIGPAADGRIKPDLWHFYDNIYTTSSSSDTSYTPSFGGTSGATPITAGYAGLVFEMWADGVFDGQPGQRRDVFDSRPHASTLKALMLNTAYQYPFSGVDDDWGRFKQGWGMTDLELMYDLAKIGDWSLPVLCDECNNIGQGQTHTYNVAVPSSTHPGFLRATLVYRDPAGSPSASKALINNIVLRVTSPSNQIYWGNHNLVETPYSTTGGSKDTTNNVENVIIETAAQGTWTVDVLGDDINSASSLPYSLVVTIGAS